MTAAAASVAIYAITLVAVRAYHAVLRSGRARTPAYVALGALLLLLPLLVPSDVRWLRFVMAVHCLAVVLKLHDAGDPRTRLPDARTFVRWFLNPTSFVWRKLDAEPTPSARANVARIVRGVVKTSLGAGAAVIVWTAPVTRVPFFVEHVVKVFVFYAMVLGGADVLVSAMRLASTKARDPIDGSIFTARTPAEFWRRYNRSVGQFFWEDLFPRFGGIRHPVRATLLVFAFSSLIHEYVFGIAIGAVQGWQTAFFMVQGVAVAATLRLRPRRGLATVATFAFNAMTSVLFFESVNQLVPFWATR
ncbi:MAG TPA: MBOAT family O-acyltransferase [Labilithrix sp.]|jgi:hypothetical protein